MRFIPLFLLVLTLGCNRPALPVPADGGGGASDNFDLAGADLLPFDCTQAPDCYTCCAGLISSGALDFTGAAQTCACGENGVAGPCTTPCATTLCGSTLGANAACVACIDSIEVDGGACQQQIQDCIDDYGACGAWKTCVDRCGGQ